MKKLLASLLAMSMILVGCSGEKKTPEIALITDAGNINDKSFNQSAWEAIEEFVAENESTYKSAEHSLGYKYYRPQQFDTAGYSEQIDLAVENGAKVIVTPGFKFEDAVAAKQIEYPDVKFIFIDATPKGDIASNVYCALYAEEEAGYLAGYAAVKDGNTKLGFMGGMALPAVVRFGYGYIQGADAAAKEMGVNVEVKYHYTGSFEAKPEIKTLADTWYQGGTEVIFSCGGGICTSIFQAAADAQKLTIGVDSDQKDDSETVLTSAVKGVKKTVKDQLKFFYEGTFEGGKADTLRITDDYVGLSEDYSRFKSYTKEQNDALVAKLKSGSVTIKNDTDVASAKELSTENVTVIEAE